MSEKSPRRLEFDMRGQICPSSLLTALQEINKHRSSLRAGEVELSFKTDNREATVTIPESAANMGYAVKVKKEEDHYIVNVGKKIEEGTS